MNASSPSFGMAFKLNENCTAAIRRNLSSAETMTNFKNTFAMPLHQASEEMGHQLQLTKTPFIKKIIGKLVGKKQEALQLELTSKIMSDSYRTINVAPAKLQDTEYLSKIYSRAINSMQNQNEKDKAYMAIRGLDPKFQEQMRNTFR